MKSGSCDFGLTVLACVLLLCFYRHAPRAARECHSFRPCNPDRSKLGREPINLPAHGLPESAMPR
jgi:hypothetical protein